MMKKILPLVCMLGAASLGALEESELKWERPVPSVQEFNGYLQEALRDEDWWAVLDYADIIAYNFPTSPFAKETAFLMGEAYFHLGELIHANQAFSAYLSHQISPRHFEKAIEYKFTIAEQFRGGEKKRLFGSHKLPKIVPAGEDAIAIYDEVIAAMPHSEMAAQSLLGKAEIQAEMEEYQDSLDTLDLLIRRFPKSELAAEGYLRKNQMYLAQCKAQNLDPNLLDLADVNLRKLKLAFPREGRVAGAESAFAEMQEAFARNLFETGAFFEKTKKRDASKIYYQKVIAKYPKTQAAEKARGKLEGSEQ